MAIYVALLAVVLLCGCVYLQYGESNTKVKNRLLNIIFISIFLVCVLRSPEVGRDVLGYKRIYELTALVDFWNFEYVYFEKGYQLLMKVCILLGMSFQQFFTVVYLIILLPIYLIVRKYSKNIILSSLVYICYMFFTFNLTGIRQAIASSICFIAYIVLLQSKRFGLVKYILIVLLATTFHNAAYACILFALMFLIKKLRTFTIVTTLATIVVAFTRNNLMYYIKLLFGKDTMVASASMYIGLNFIFVVALAIMFYITERIISNNPVLAEDGGVAKSKYDVSLLSTKMFMLSIFFLVLFGSDTSVRSYMVLNQVIILHLPNILCVFEKKSRSIITAIMVVFFIVFFFTDSLIPNSFDIVPYKFFWQ